MKKFLIYLPVLALVTIVACTKTETDPASGAQNESSSQYIVQDIPGQYIVVLANESQIQKRLSQEQNYSQRKEAVHEEANTVLSSHGISVWATQLVYAKSVVGFSAVLSQEELTKLKTDTRISHIEQDKLITLITVQGKPGGGGTPPPQSLPWGVTRVGGSAAGIGKTGWIIDSGVDLDHPDLNVNVSKSATFIGGNSTPDDQNGHGTHVAGTIAGKNNSAGTIGVAAGASVVSVRVLDRRGSGSISQVIAGVDYVAANALAGDAANMSLGGGISDVLDAAVLNASNTGIWFVLAAGNESDNANNHSPARTNGAYIKTISAMNSSNVFASFSNYGTAVDFCAPGVSIYSCWKDGGYNTISGTSMAAPHVTGLILSGSLSSDGFVTGDPDGSPDPIAHR